MWHWLFSSSLGKIYIQKISNCCFHYLCPLWKCHCSQREQTCTSGTSGHRDSDSSYGTGCQVPLVVWTWEWHPGRCGLDPCGELNMQHSPGLQNWELRGMFCLQNWLLHGNKEPSMQPGTGQTHDADSPLLTDCWGGLTKAMVQFF